MTLTSAAPYLIAQKYEDYTAEQQSVWAELVRRRRPQVEAFACEEYLEGSKIIGLSESCLPDVAAITKILNPLTGWSTTPVSGFLPADAFFEMLEARKFPVTTHIRSRESLEYTPEPDIFHDVFGHVPMHAHKVFADFLRHYGAVCAKIKNVNTLERLGRLFWYTVEFGLIFEHGAPKIYGSGIISSHGECSNLLEGGCEVRDFDLEDVLNTPVKVDSIHHLLFAIESFDQLYQAMGEAEERILSHS
jgi:phenylalanine-4-hydroxylase